MPLNDPNKVIAAVTRSEKGREPCLMAGVAIMADT